MKIALCFHGLPRLIQNCYSDIYNHFIKNNNVDIYAHFWWDESYKGKINRLHITSEDKLEKSLFKNEIQDSLRNIEIEWIKLSSGEGGAGIDAIDFETKNGLVCIK